MMIMPCAGLPMPKDNRETHQKNSKGKEKTRGEMMQVLDFYLLGVLRELIAISSCDLLG